MRQPRAAVREQAHLDHRVVVIRLRPQHAAGASLQFAPPFAAKPFVSRRKPSASNPTGFSDPANKALCSRSSFKGKTRVKARVK